jgi:sialic acid synthase SpsE
MFRRLEMSYEDHKRLFEYAWRKGIEIFSTPFDFESVDLLESLGVHFYKVASFDLVNIPLLRYIASTKKPMFISTGMSTLGQIEEALDAVRSEGNSNVILLHCVSVYPAAPEEMNLNVIKTLKSNFHVPVGLSDHTLGIMVAQLALALGANAVERHFTLDRTLEGPDHILSSEPAEMRELVRCASLINRILGDGIKKIEASEYDMINTQRKSLYARVDIAKGQVITRDMIAIKGPGVGLQPKYLDMVVGRAARRDIEADHPITWESV